jgi:2-keto-3-deoxy-L-rhamnonate aldolase RhmA
VLPLLKVAGLDFARIDMENTGLSIETVADMAVLARALDFPIAVSPPAANREWNTRLRDVGVWNLHCPEVESAQHAAEIVTASRYAPRGRRGNGGLSPATGFASDGAPAERRVAATREVFVTVTLETAWTFENLDEVVMMDGIDALTLGPADLVQDPVISGAPNQARVLDEKRDLVLHATRRHGTADVAQRWTEAGALLLAYSREAEILRDGFSAGVLTNKHYPSGSSRSGRGSSGPSSAKRVTGSGGKLSLAFCAEHEAWNPDDQTSFARLLPAAERGDCCASRLRAKVQPSSGILLGMEPR